jgi:hypothetical protein
MLPQSAISLVRSERAVGEVTDSVSKKRGRECPECGETIPSTATICPECDANLVDDDYEERDRPRQRHSQRDYEPHRGTTIMVLGILSIFMGCVGIILGPIAWIMGNGDLKKMRAGLMDPEGESLTNTGKICGMVGAILHAVGCLGVVVVWIVMLVFMGGIAVFFNKAANSAIEKNNTTNSSMEPGAPKSLPQRSSSSR